ncbi:MAG: sugar kinase [bacterium]
MSGTPAVSGPRLRSDAVGPDLVAVGEALVAFIATDGLPLTEATAFRRTVAGAEFNVAAAMARLGHRAVFAGRVGADPHGQVIEQRARTFGIDARLVRDVEAATGVLVRDVGDFRPTGVQYARASSAGSRLCAQDLDFDLVASARCVHVSGITASLSDSAEAAVCEVMRRARDAGVLVSFDPNLRWRMMDPQWARSSLPQLAGLASVLVAGADELAWLADSDEGETALDWAFEQGVELVVVKRGEHGAMASDGVARCEVPARARRPVDVVGAGDAFAAGLLAGLLEGKSVEAAMADAAVVAAFVVSTVGDLEGLPDRDLRDSFSEDGGEVRR